MISKMPTHCVQTICSWKMSMAAIMPKTYARLLSGYAMEKGQCLRIYIQSKPAAVNDSPHAGHHQLVSWLTKNDHVHEARSKALSASFIKICPPQRKRLCKIAKRISFILLIFYIHVCASDVTGLFADERQYFVPSVYLFVKLQDQGGANTSQSHLAADIHQCARE